MRWQKWSQRALLWAFPAVMLVLYASLACRTVSAFGDSAELGAAAAVGGVPHPPGYPLLTWLGHVFFSTLGGDPAWRMHLSSAVAHAVGLWLVAKTLLHVTKSVVSTAVALVLLAFSRTYFLGSLYLETFPLNDLFVALTYYVAVRTVGDLECGRQPLGSGCALGAVLGLAGAHHQTIVLVLPGLILIFLPWARQLSARALGGFAGGGLTTFLGSWVLLWWAAMRRTEVDWGDLRSVPDLIAHLTRQDYGGLFSASKSGAPWLFARRQLAFMEILEGSVGWAGLALLFAAITAVVARRHRLGLSAVTTLVLSGPLFFAINRVGLEREEQLAWCERFASMAHVPLALALGIGLSEGLSWLEARHASASRWAAASSALCVIPPALLWPSYDLSSDRVGPDMARDLVLRTPDRSVLILRGDLHQALAEHECVVYRTCGERILLPVHREWRYERIRHENPGLGLPPWDRSLSKEGLPRLVHKVVLQRAVFISPQAVQAAPHLLREFQVAPDILLWRIVPSDVSAAPIVSTQAATAASDGCALCASVPETLPRPTMHAQTYRMYEMGFTGLAAQLARSVGPAPLVNELLQRAKRFELPALTSGVVDDG